MRYRRSWEKAHSPYWSLHVEEVAGGGNGAIDGAAAALFARSGSRHGREGACSGASLARDLFAPALALAGLAPDRGI